VHARLAELSRGSRNEQIEASFAAEPRANSPPHPSRQPACHGAVCSVSRGRGLGMMAIALASAMNDSSEKYDAIVKTVVHHCVHARSNVDS